MSDGASVEREADTVRSPNENAAGSCLDGADMSGDLGARFRS